jgi:hypothetical protein
MVLHEPFGHLQHKLWSKEGLEVKLAIWLPTTKSQESTRPRCVQVKCNTPLEALEESYKFASDLIPTRGLSWELWAPKVSGVQTGTVSELLLGNPETKSHSDAGVAEQRRILYGGRWWFPPSLGRGESSESVLHVACPNTKSDSECELTNLLVGFDAGPNN